MGIHDPPPVKQLGPEEMAAVFGTGCARLNKGTGLTFSGHDVTRAAWHGSIDPDGTVHLQVDAGPVGVGVSIDDGGVDVTVSVGDSQVTVDSGGEVQGEILGNDVD